MSELLKAMLGVCPLCWIKSNLPDPLCESCRSKCANEDQLNKKELVSEKE